MWKGCLTLYTGTGELQKIGEFWMVCSHSLMCHISVNPIQIIEDNKTKGHISEEKNNSLNSNMGTGTSGPVGNGVQTGPESRGCQFSSW